MLNQPIHLSQLGYFLFREQNFIKLISFDAFYRCTNEKIKNPTVVNVFDISNQKRENELKLHEKYKNFNGRCLIMGSGNVIGVPMIPYSYIDEVDGKKRE